MSATEVRRSVTTFGVLAFACVLLTLFATPETARWCFGIGATASTLVLALLALEAARSLPPTTDRKHRA